MKQLPTPEMVVKSAVAAFKSAMPYSSWTRGDITPEAANNMIRLLELVKNDKLGQQLPPERKEKHERTIFEKCETEEEFLIIEILTMPKGYMTSGL